MGLHCTAHRLELAVKDAMKDFPSAIMMRDFLDTVYKFYHNSPQNWAGLRESGNAINVTVRKPSKAAGTRWVGHWEQALSTVIFDWEPLIEHLLQVKIADKGDRGRKAAGLYNQLISLQFLLHSQFLLLIFRTVLRLSLKMQDNKALLANVSDSIQQCEAKLNSIDPKQRIIKFVTDEIGENLLYKDKTLSLVSQTRARGRVDATKDSIVDDVSAECENILQRLRECISSRFADFNTQGQLINAFGIFDPANWPDRTAALVEYGIEDLELLLMHFKPILDAKGFNTESEVCDDTFVDIIRYAKRLCAADNTLISSPNFLWAQVLRNKGHVDSCPFPGSAVLALVNIMLVMASSSADAERGFSHMKHIKSDWRASLQSNVLSDLLTIKLSGHGLLDSHDIIPAAISMWHLDVTRHGRRFVAPHGAHRKMPPLPNDSDSQSD